MDKTKQNILLFTLEYPPFKGGVANVYGRIVRHWSSHIEVLTGDQLIRPHWLMSLWHLWRAVRKYRVRHVLVGHLLPLGSVTYLLSKFTGLRYTVFLHGMDIALAVKVARKRRLARLILRDAEHIIALNSYVPKVLQREFGNEFADSVVVVNPGVEFRIKNSECRMQNDLLKKYDLKNKKVLLQVGRLVERKGFDKVLEVLPEVLKECKDLKYIMVGNGQLEQDLRFKIKDLRLERNVILVTDANDEEVSAWYELCDIFIMAARDIDGDVEGFGLVYLEANAHGKPVIAGDSGGVRDAVKPDLNGLLVNPESAEEIKHAIITLYKDEFLRRRLGQRGREWARSFDWQKQVEKMERVVNSEQ